MNRPWVRSSLSAIAIAAVLAGAALPFAVAATPAEAGTSSARLAPVDPAVVEQINLSGQTTFWVILKERADLSLASSVRHWSLKGSIVVDTLRATADRTQAPLRALLTSKGASFQSFWIVNAIRVTGDDAILASLAARPEVAEIRKDESYQIPDPIPAKPEPTVNVVEWGIDRIRAPQVWSSFTRGDGIVVANIDTGFQFNHPALVRQYRGNMGGGVFDHNYNWFDPSNVCGNPSLVPCDNNGHGTHTMGTMVGDDGDPGTNQIGVAPHARFIGAKGCETNSCSTSALLASGQWVLAPRDLNGQNPRPDLRPHVVNNSWGGGPGDPWYQATVDAWIASGIFPAFSNGNAGPGCASSGSPGDYVRSYSAGAFDISNNIAAFSSRGPSAFGGELKPNIAAPGVSVRSSVPTNSYAAFSGTSMASPHVAGTVALMWSAAPLLVGDIAGTRTILDNTAIDTSDLTCGGTADDNNVWGEGRLDAYEAVINSPIGDMGPLTGMVTDSSNNNPIGGATVQAVGVITRTTTTDASGNYSMSLLVDPNPYQVTASKFGYISETQSVLIAGTSGAVANFTLDPAPTHAVSGHVRDAASNPLAGATVTILNTPIPPATTDAAGFYSFSSVPEGTYSVRAEAGRCNTSQTQPLVVDGNETLDFTLQQRSDSFGYFCQIVPFSYLEANTVLPLTGDDAAVQVPLPFPFTFYGLTHSTAFVTTNGNLNFLALNASFSNVAIPNTAAPNGAIYPFWDDLFVDSAASVRTQLLGTAPNRQFVIEWRNVHFFADNTRRLDFEAVLYENGRILTQYRNLANDGREMGNSATVGIENQTGTVALQYSFNEAALTNDLAVLYRLPPSGFVEGTVTDYNDTLALAGATVKAIRGGAVVRQTTTNAAGFYRIQLPLETYMVEASKTNYVTASAEVVLDEEDEVVTRNFALRTARAEIAPTSLQIIAPPNETRTRMLTLRNTGSADMTWEIRETGGGMVSAGTAGTPPRNPAYDPNSPTTEGLYVGATPAGWAPNAPGDVIRSWPPTGLSLAWGVGYTGNVWLSDVPTNRRNHEFTVMGAATGRNWPTPWAGAWPGDMALDTSNNCMAQVNVGGDNGIYCWDMNTGAVVYSITGAFPWTSISQRGLAYRADDDSFYIGGWNQRILYHVRGRSHGTPGAVIGQCNPADGNISGLAWNPAFGRVWAATNSPTDTIYQLNPDTCAVLATLPHPSPGFAGAGLEMDEVGNLWMIDQSPNTVYLIESGLPSFVDVPWLSEDPTSGTLAPNGVQQIQVMVDTTGLSPGVYMATLFVNSNSGRQPTLQVPVQLIVPAYMQGVNAGGDVYVDGLGDTWAADQEYAAGSWGYLNSASREASTRRSIDGTEDDPLYQDLRQSPTEYRFDGLPPGVYEVELRFAEIQHRLPGTRLFDVTIEGGIVLLAHDIAAEVGSFAADDHSFFFVVTDGQVSIRLIERRGYAPPIINAVRVRHRPDR